MLRVLFTIFLLSLGNAVQAQSFDIVGDDDFPPFSFIDSKGQVSGIDVDLVNELGRRMGLEFNIKLVPFKRVLKAVEAGQAFAGFALFRTPEREAFGYYTHPIHYSTYKLFTLADSSLTYNSIEDLFGKRIGVQAGFDINPIFNEAVANQTLRRVDIFSPDDIFALLSRGRFDAFVGNSVVMQYKLHKDFRDRYDFQDFKVLDKPINDSRGAYLVLSKAFPNEDMAMWRVSVSETLRAMEEDGFYQKVIDRYIPASSATITTSTTTTNTSP